MSDLPRQTYSFWPEEALWDESLAKAAAELDPADPLAQIFLEAREDLRLEIASRGAPRLAHTRFSGASARRGGLRSRLVHVHDPSPDDLVALARSSSLPSSELGRARNRDLGLISGPEIDGSGWRGLTARLVEAALASVEPGEQVEVEAEYVAFRQSVRIARPSRAVTGDRRSGGRIRLDAKLVKGASSGAARADLVERGGDSPDPESWGRRVVARARERLGSAPPRRGECHAVFAPGVGGILLHELVGHALEADTVLQGRSSLASRSGRVAAASARVLDDPRRGRGGWRVDDEGEPARATPLLDGGRVAGLMNDLRSAVSLGRRPTGHARRSAYHEDVVPRMGCTFLAAGSATADDVISETGAGIYVRRLECATVSPMSGRAMFVVTDADEIVSGRVSEPLAPFIIYVETVPTLLSLDLIAHDLAFDTCVGACLREGQPLATSVGAPTFRTGVITVVP